MTTPARLNELHHAENPARELLENWAGRTSHAKRWRRSAGTSGRCC